MPNNLENLGLWKIFEKKANDKQRQIVRDLTNHSINLLDLIRDTFPTYTLHNHVHAENVVELMGKLLGDEIKNITALEGAILILSAYYHDIGMVFRENERNNLSKEPSCSVH
jgi:HD-GYP domain-containing protein (c-di-GMP phosphodiesterase class II)